MKVFEITQPQDPMLSIQKLKTLADKIRANCQPFLQKIGNNPTDTILWRGSPDLDETKLVTKVRNPKNRHPRDTDPHVSEVADEWFKDKFGIAYRSNALFVTGKYRSAEEYGSVYIVLPIGEFRFCWSPEVEDFTYGLVPGEEITQGYDDTYRVMSRLDKVGYIETDLVAAAKSNCEIMIYCPAGFYLISNESPLSGNLMRAIKDPDYFEKTEYLRSRVIYLNGKIVSVTKYINALNIVKKRVIRDNTNIDTIPTFLARQGVPDPGHYVLLDRIEEGIKKYQLQLNKMQKLLVQTRAQLDKLAIPA